MFETVSVDQAIKKGHRMINYPILGGYLGVITLTMVLAFNRLIPIDAIGFMVPVLLILGYLYWAMAVPKWKIWAFDNVRNVHELEKRAIREKLIWPSGSFISKAEIWRASDKEKWHILQDKFLAEDLVEDDPSVPPETTLYYDKKKMKISLVFGAAFLGFGIYQYYYGINTLYGGVCIIVSLVVGFTTIRKLMNRQAKLVINEKGTQFPDEELCEWNQICDEDVAARRSFKNQTQMLVFLYKDTSKEMNIDNLDTDSNSLIRLMAIYRTRYNRKEKIKKFPADEILP